MRLSAAKINHLAHLIADEILDEPGLECFYDKNDVRLRIKLILTDELRLEDEIDKHVRRTISSSQKSPPEGSREWEVLYEKFFEEELNRRRRGRLDGVRRMR